MYIIHIYFVDSVMSYQFSWYQLSSFDTRSSPNISSRKGTTFVSAELRRYLQARARNPNEPV